MAEENKISFLPVTTIMITDSNGESRWVDLYALVMDKENINAEEIARIKEVISKGEDAVFLLSKMKDYYKKEIMGEIKDG